MSLIAALAALTLTAASAREPILLDARCDESAWGRAERTYIGGGATLLLMTDRRNLFVCVLPPPDSLATLDLYIQPRDGAPVNLHVSAQTGERTRTEAGWPEWGGFGNHERWYGPPVAFTGFAEQPDGSRRPVFANSAARELQISRERFGRGPWRITLQVRALGADRTGSVNFPASGDVDDPSTWETLQFR